MAIWMSIVLTTTVVFSGNVATTSTTFDTNDDPDCAKTARVTLGNEVMKDGVEWFVLKDRRGGGTVTKTLVCVPRAGGYKDE